MREVETGKCYGTLETYLEAKVFVHRGMLPDFLLELALSAWTFEVVCCQSTLHFVY